MNDDIYSEEQIINMKLIPLTLLACAGLLLSGSAWAEPPIASPKSVTLGPPSEHFLFKTDLSRNDMGRNGVTVWSVSAGETVTLTIPWQNFPIIVEIYHDGKQIPWHLDTDSMVWSPVGWLGWTVNHTITNAQPADAGRYMIRSVTGTDWVTNNFRIYVGSLLHIEMLWISEGVMGVTYPNLGLLLVGDPKQYAPRYTVEYTTDMQTWFRVFDVMPSLTYPPSWGNGPTGSQGPTGQWVSTGNNTAIIWLRYWGGNRWFRAVPQPF